jgi:hypothetical protein
MRVWREGDPDYRESGRDAVLQHGREGAWIMFGLGMPDPLVILVIALLVVETKSLPKIGSGIGKAIRGFTEEADEGDGLPLAGPRGSLQLSARRHRVYGRGEVLPAVWQAVNGAQRRELGGAGCRAPRDLGPHPTL